MADTKTDVCCDLHVEGAQPIRCCDPDDCGPCCERCPTCPTLKLGRARDAGVALEQEHAELLRLAQTVVAATDPAGLPTGAFQAITALRDHLDGA